MRRTLWVFGLLLAAGLARHVWAKGSPVRGDLVVEANGSMPDAYAAAHQRYRAALKQTKVDPRDASA